MKSLPGSIRTTRACVSMLAPRSEESRASVFTRSSAERMPVEGTFQGRRGRNVRLPLSHSFAVQQAQPRNTILSAIFGQLLEFLDLMGVGGYDQFPAIPMRNVILSAECVQLPIALHAQPRFQGILRIINTGMDHAAVPRTGCHSQIRRLFHQERRPPTAAIPPTLRRSQPLLRR